MAWTTMDNTNLLLDIILIAMALRLSLRSCLVVMATFAVCCGDECSAVSESRSIAFMKCSGTTEDLTDRSPQEVIHQLQRTVQTQKAEIDGLRKQLIDSGELGEDDGETQSNQASSKSDWSSRRRRRRSTSSSVRRRASTSFSNRRRAATSSISRRRSRVSKEQSVASFSRHSPRSTQQCPKFEANGPSTPRMSRRMTAKCCFGLDGEPPGSLDCSGSGGCVRDEQMQYPTQHGHCNGGANCPDGITSQGVFFPGFDKKGTCILWGKKPDNKNPYLHCSTRPANSKTVEMNSKGHTHGWTKICTKKAFIEKHQASKNAKLYSFKHTRGIITKPKTTILMVMKRITCRELYSKYYKTQRTICYVFKAGRCVSYDDKEKTGTGRQQKFTAYDKNWIQRLIDKQGKFTKIAQHCDTKASKELADTLLAF